MVDRVETTFTVWLGLTMGCARCHDHKFDPLSQKEFYQAFAYFNNIPEFGRAIKEGNSPPFIKAPTEAQQRELAALNEDLKTMSELYQRLEPSIQQRQRDWENLLREDRGQNPIQWFPSDGSIAHFPLEENFANRLEKKAKPPINTKAKFQAGPLGKAVKLTGQGQEAGAIANFSYFDKFSFSFWIKPEKPTGTILSKMQDTARASGYAVQLQEGKLQVNLVKRWLDDAIRVETAKPISLNQWQHIAVTYDGSRVAKGIRVYLNGKPIKMTVKLDLINQNFAVEEPFRIGQGGGPKSGFHGLLDDLRIFADCLSSEDVQILSVKESISELVKRAEEKRTTFQARKLRTYHMEHGHADFWKAFKQLRKKRDALVENLPTVMVMQENPDPSPTHILKRGQYDHPGEAVSRNVPKCLPSLSFDLPNNRLGFAKWIMDGNNPLTARVAVNRLWQLSFGQGLVKTTEDFGSQGERASHPELLDWLAVELMNRNWRLEEIQRLIVTSAVYRQSSKVTKTLWQKDPDNRLLARGPRFRLSAGIIRDQALAVSGLLAERLGGPSVKPYQPAGLWTELANEQPYQHDHGESLYRRSFYTYWKRTIGPPGLLAFDASTRETCQVRPSRTNTPLQALTLMNDTIFVEASRKMAERVIREGGKTVNDRLTFAFRLAASRKPKPEELRILTSALAAHFKRFQQHPKAASVLLTIGESPTDSQIPPVEIAAYATLCNLLLNLDEVVTRE